MVCDSKHGLNFLVDLLVQIQKEKLLNSFGKIKQAVHEKLKEYKESLNKFLKGCKNRKDFFIYLKNFCKDYDNNIINILINVKSYLSKEPTNKNCLEVRIRNECIEFKKNLLSKYINI